MHGPNFRGSVLSNQIRSRASVGLRLGETESWVGRAWRRALYTRSSFLLFTWEMVGQSRTTNSKAKRGVGWCSYMEFLAAVSRPQRPHARRQPSSMSHYDMPNLTVTGDDGRTTTYVVLTRHKQHQRTSAQRSISDQQPTFRPTSSSDTSTTTTGS
jgi:hypothetical protein